MKASIIKIGNSKGVRIPKPLLAESGIDKFVDIIVKKGELRIKAISSPRVDGSVTKMSETTLAKDWLNKSEDEAWKNL